MRQTEAKEDAKLSEFQQELVQMAAVFQGDHTKDVYRDKLLEEMNVARGATYVENAYKRFCDDCKKAKQSGEDEAHIVVPTNPPASEPKPKSFTQKLCSCLVCDKD